MSNFVIDTEELRGRPPEPEKVPGTVFRATFPWSPVVLALWPVVLPAMKELADASMGEFTVDDIRDKLWRGPAQLYVVYATDDVPASEGRSSRRAKEEYAGFFTAIVDGPARSFHLWNVYAVEKYRNQEFIGAAYKRIEDNCREQGISYISMGAKADVWDRYLVDKLGYTKTFTTYRKQVR